MDGKTAVVVGGTSGWGLGAARGLARAGAKVIVNGTDRERTEGAVESVREFTSQVRGVSAMADDPDAAEALINAAVETFGSVDILVNSAGAKFGGTVAQLERKDVERTIGAQLMAPIYCTRFAAEVMIRQGRGGRIINVAGGAAIRGVRGQSVHAATKGAIVAASLSWAEELWDHGITVNCVRGGVQSRGAQPVVAAIRRGMARRGLAVPNDDRELGFFEPDDAAQLVVWLASERAAGVTAQFLGIDGPTIRVWSLVTPEDTLTTAGTWTVDSMDEHLRPVLLRITEQRRADAGLGDISGALRFAGSA
jgi:NAD(P)-dependent dehydrogenase (short-subunit alcohol dehydrogenase family)